MALSIPEKRLIRYAIGDGSLGNQLIAKIDTPAAVGTRLTAALATMLGSINRARLLATIIATPAAMTQRTKDAIYVAIGNHPIAQLVIANIENA